MLFLIEVPKECEAQAEQIKQLSQKLLTTLQNDWKALQWNPSERFESAQIPPHTAILKIRKGAIRVSSGRSLFMLLEENDLFDPGLMQNEHSSLFFGSDLPVEIDALSSSHLNAQLASHTEAVGVWAELFKIQAQIYMEISASFAKERAAFEPQLTYAEAGKIIIEQGSLSSDVYTMVEGEADVLVDGVHVGKIKENQIFGALAAFSSTPRSATVRAAMPCSYLVLPEREFIALMKARPETVLALCHDMANTIQRLNKRVVELSKKSSGSNLT